MEWGLLEPPEEVNCKVDGVMVGRTLVDLHKEATHLRVVNLSHEPKPLAGALLWPSVNQSAVSPFLQHLHQQSRHLSW